MQEAHWIFLLALGLLVGLMLSFSLLAAPHTKAYGLTRRLFWALVFLQGCSALGVLGVNGVNLALAAWLGAPGCAALMVLALL